MVQHASPLRGHAPTYFLFGLGFFASCMAAPVILSAASQNTALLAYGMGRALYTPASQIFFAFLLKQTRQILAFLVFYLRGSL